MLYSGKLSLLFSKSSLNILITIPLPLTTDISAESIADTDAEAGERKLIVYRHPQVIGKDFSFVMADKQIVDVQAEAELIVEQAIEQTGADTIRGAHQIDALILAGSIGVVETECMRRHEVLPEERTYIRFGIHVHYLEENKFQTVYIGI